MSETRFTATKFDDKKPPMDLIPWEAMEEVAKVLDFGRQKYAPHNWRKGFLWTRLASAALRHIFSWLSGEDNDQESGLSHIAHATCCLMFLMAHVKSKLGKDDRAHVLLTDQTVPAAYVPKHKKLYYAIECNYLDVGWQRDSMHPGKYATRAIAEKAAEHLPQDFYRIIEVEE